MFEKYKCYLPFFATVGIFSIMIVSLAVLYIRWNKVNDQTPTEIEITGAIIDFDKYFNLSKQYTSTNIESTNQ